MPLQQTENFRILNDVLGQHPNRQNCSMFFKNPGIKFLWQELFVQSVEYSTWRKKVMSFPADHRYKFNNNVLKLCDEIGYEFIAPFDCDS